ncbi:MAG: hypothetical protein IKA79_09815 [Lentisphaeria bacterium]|nr:hypothetical protein [Lentisphaeria bacterium]
MTWKRWKTILFLFFVFFIFSADALEDLTIDLTEERQEFTRSGNCLDSFLTAYQAKILHSFSKAGEHFSLIFSSAKKESVEKTKEQINLLGESTIKHLQEEAEKLIQDPSGFKKSDSPRVKEVTKHPGSIPEKGKNVSEKSEELKSPERSFERSAEKRNYKKETSKEKYCIGNTFEKKSFKKQETAVSGNLQSQNSWRNNFRGARQTAFQTKKLMLLLFTVSDMRTQNTLVARFYKSNPYFLQKANKDYVLVHVDLPRDKYKLSFAHRRQNEDLRSRFSVLHYPTVVILDPVTPGGSLIYKYTGTLPDKGLLQHLEENIPTHLKKYRKVRAVTDL